MQKMLLITLLSIIFSNDWGTLNSTSQPKFKGQGSKAKYTDKLALNHTMANDYSKMSITDINKGPATRQLSNAGSLYKSTAPSVVFIYTASGLGSGVIIGKNEIVTNFHVVKRFDKVGVVEYSKDLTTLGNIDVEEDTILGEVVAVDEKRDLALIRTDKSFTSQARFATNWKIEITDDVYAIGHPEGLWGFTYGVISSLPSPKIWNYTEFDEYKADCIQTQTPTNPGNSGGPLFNSRGQLVGVNTYGNSIKEGLNFAVRVNEVKDFIGKARSGGYPHGKEWVGQWEPISYYDWIQFEGYGFFEGIDYKTFQVAGKDTTQDGFINVWWGYVGDNEEPSVRWGDINADGVVDWVHYVSDGEYYIDENFDGTPDTLGLDTNNDWEPDTFKPLKS